MTKIDFAIHLLSKARGTLGGETNHVATTALLVMFECSRRGVGQWHPGPEIARSFGIPANRMTGSCRNAVALGYLTKRKTRSTDQGRKTDPLEWSITAKGQRVVAKVLDTSAKAEPPLPA